MQHNSYSLHNLRTLPQIGSLSEDQIREIEIAGSVLPFKVNNYVTDRLIDWSNVPQDPIFIATFPQKDMLPSEDYEMMKILHESNASSYVIREAADQVRSRLNPHPAGQVQYNAPVFNGRKLYGIQHKYRETMLVFPAEGQTCHAFCTFCFRWPQFTGTEEFSLSYKSMDMIVQYVRAHPEITDVLITGGDPLMMKSQVLAKYIEPLLAHDLPGLHTIRLGSKLLSHWPYRLTTDNDAQSTLNLFRRISQSGKHLAFMAQFNHPVELGADVVKEAIARILDTGAIIRTQSPLLRHINDSPQIWAETWRRQIALNCIPYYMFVTRDTGAQHYFSVPLVEAWRIFKEAYHDTSGLCRTVRGPSMSCLPGKVEIVGPAEMSGERVLTLRMIQGRNPDWVDRPFFAAYDEDAAWYDELRPAFGAEKFFFQDELDTMLEEGDTDVGFE